MVTCKLAVIIKNSLSSDSFLVIRQTSPPIPDVEYGQFVDSDLWDLPSIELKSGDKEKERSDISISGADSVSDKINLSSFNVGLAINQILKQVRLDMEVKNWVFDNFVEEPEFGPGLPIHTIFVAGNLDTEIDNIPDSCKWISKDCALDLLLEVKKHGNRIGPLTFIGLLHESSDGEKWKASQNFQCQAKVCCFGIRNPSANQKGFAYFLIESFKEYPPGVMIMPMKSRTQAPFHTTNLIVMVPRSDKICIQEENCIAYADALLLDPGCCTESHSKLADLVAALPRNLVVFVTHHHRDHTDGLSVVQKCNPDSTLLAHESTMNRINKDTWSLGYTVIAGGEKIRIGGEILEALFAPGHTDGHLALLHLSTNSLIVGDHCVGQGSAILDVRAGGNMKRAPIGPFIYLKMGPKKDELLWRSRYFGNKDYFSTTYRFLELSPHVLIPLHGRINLWPKRMLCGYIKNRKAREASILKVIESGAQTLFGITAMVYADVDTKLWLPASSNVRVHVDHLAYQEKLPKEFSMKKFQSSCHLHFICRWTWSYLTRRKISYTKVLAVLGGVGVVLALIHKCISY